VGMYNDIENFHVNEQVSYPDSPFDKLVRDTFSGKNKDNHYIYVLDVGDEALLSRIHLIRSAKKSINIQTFIWANDESGRYVAYELIQAAKRGVKVRIINDQWRLDDTSELVAWMVSAHPNLELRNYNPSANKINPSKIRLLQAATLQFKKVNQRMHNKIFVVDDRIAITGGRNYENDYYDRGYTRNFKDRDVMVVGPVVKKMTESFMQYWAFKFSIPCNELVDVIPLLKSKKFPVYSTKESLDPNGLLDDIDKSASDYEMIQKTFVDRAFMVNKVRFVYDKPGKNQGRSLAGGSESAEALNEFLARAKETIYIQTPYLVMDKQMASNIKKLRKKNKNLDILVSSNSLAATDNIYAYSFSYKQKKLFIKDLRLRIFELKPVPKDAELMMPRFPVEQSLNSKEIKQLPAHSIMTEEENSWESQEKHLCVHGKSFVVDGETAWIGSFNVDPRSTHLNTEVGLIIDDQIVAQAVQDNIERDMAPHNSWTIGKRQDVLLISQVRALISNTLQKIPLVDVWPFRYTASFEIKKGKDIVPFYDEEFFDNYKSVGSFPQVNLSIREIQIRLLKTFGGFATPII